MNYIKNFFLLLLLPLLVFAENIEDPYKDIYYEQLDNGLKVYLLSDTQAETTRIIIDVQVGDDVETTENIGLSHLVEHLVFRDQRVPYKDYLDYMKEEGATEVNAYTHRYTTEYFATIGSEKSYWLVKTFFQMIFDKKINKEDLDVEKKALQTEIGELQWYSKTSYYIASFFKLVGESFPKRQEDIYENDFGLEKPKELPEKYFSRRNNKLFSLDDMLKHYSDYYYPANMTMKVTGNFNLEKMIKLIHNKYGSVTRTGDKKSKEPVYNASLSGKAFEREHTGKLNKSQAYLGTKYILDDYKKYLILTSYSDNLAQRMQQLLRNELGKTYSVSSMDYTARDAGVAGVSFGSLHDSFHTNIKDVNNQIQTDTKAMKREDIINALEAASLYYSNVEHDSTSLLDLIETQEYLHKYHNVFDKTPYEVFQSINVSDFQNEITKAFVDENRYSYISNDYYLFPYDISLLSLFLIVVMIYAYIRITQLYLKKKGLFYQPREVLFTRRITNRFFSFLNFVLLIFITVWFSEWSEALVSMVLFGNTYSLDTLNSVAYYIYFILGFVWFMFLLIVLSLTLFRHFFVRLDVTKDRLNFIGRALLIINKSEIKEIKKVNWSIDKFLKIFGFSFLFYKPLVMLTLEDGRTIYVRTKNADELEEDLNDWKDKE